MPEENKELRENLFYNQKNGCDLIDTAERIAVEDYSEKYKSYLDNARLRQLNGAASCHIRRIWR